MALTPVFDSLGSYPPVWADAWTFMGSLLATYGMARGWTEFWLIWVAVDIVGVPLLFSAGYYASAVMYLFYGFFTLAGFFVWWRASRLANRPVTVETAFPDPAGGQVSARNTAGVSAGFSAAPSGAAPSSALPRSALPRMLRCRLPSPPRRRARGAPTRSWAPSSSGPTERTSPPVTTAEPGLPTPKPTPSPRRRRRAWTSAARRSW